MATVLVVDDHDGFRSYARQFLDSNGFEVIGEASTGAAAVSEARRLMPEIVLVDVQLPDIDGFDVTRLLLAEPKPPAVVLISSREAADYGSSIATSGARGFVTKSRLSGDVIRDLVR